MNSLQKLLDNNSIFVGLSISIIVFGIVMALVLTNVEALEQEEELEVTDEVKVTKDVKSSYTEPPLVVTQKLKHKIGVSGNFDGIFDRELINTEGKFRISSDTDTFVLVGTFENTSVQHWNPISGVYITSNPNCQNIVGDLILESKETKINLEFNGKNCTYGLTSYVIGTFETTESVGKYEGLVGKGSMTFVADHHTNKVSGQLKGSFR